jgi:hypothetical protein
MKFEELKTKYSDMDADMLADIEKVVQGETDAVRTEYSKQLKDLEKYKPHEKSDVEKQLDEANSKLAVYEFGNKLKQKGLNTELSKFLKSDIDLDEFSKLYQTKNKSDDFVPNSTNTTGSGISKQDFEKMNYAERAKLYEESPELFNELNK